MEVMPPRRAAQVESISQQHSGLRKRGSDLMLPSVGDMPYSSEEDRQKRKYSYNSVNNRIPLREHRNLKGVYQAKVVKLPPIMARKIL